MNFQTKEEAAAYLNIGVASIRSYVSRGKLIKTESGYSLPDVVQQSQTTLFQKDRVLEETTNKLTVSQEKLDLVTKTLFLRTNVATMRKYANLKSEIASQLPDNASFEDVLALIEIQLIGNPKLLFN